MMRFLLTVFFLATGVFGQPRPVDTEHSKLIIHAEKSGVFAFAAHDHQITAPIAGGEIVEGEKAVVNLRFEARQMQVIDPKESEKTRADIRKEMLSARVLDAEKYPEITFRSTQVRAGLATGWVVVGELSLHGQTRPISVQVSKQNGIFRGAAEIKQTDFGITPISIAGGTVRIKDELKIEFEIRTK